MSARTTLQKILLKRELTGSDVGKVLLLNLVESKKQEKLGNEMLSSIISQTDFNNMFDRAIRKDEYLKYDSVSNYLAKTNNLMDDKYDLTINYIDNMTKMMMLSLSLNMIIEKHDGIKDSKMLNVLTKHCIEQYTSMTPYKEKNLAKLSDMMEYIHKMCYSVSAWNKCIDMLIDIVNVKQLEVFKYGEDKIKCKIEGYMKLINQYSELMQAGNQYPINTEELRLINNELNYKELYGEEIIPLIGMDKLGEVESMFQEDINLSVLRDYYTFWEYIITEE